MKVRLIKKIVQAIGISAVSVITMAPLAFATPSVPDPAPSSAMPLQTLQAAAPPAIIQPDVQFMRLPFKRADAPFLKITNGWKMSPDEAKVLGDTSDHAAVDYEGVPYGTPLYAPADGWAWYSYQSFPMRYQAPYDPSHPSNPATFWRDPYTGREGYLGAAGLFVEIQFNKEVKRPDGTSLGNIATQFFHLKAVAPSITYYPPIRLNDVIAYNGQRIKIWQPLVNKPQAYMRAHASPIKRGQLIGWMGDTGINFGYDDNFDVATGTVASRNRVALPPWDPQGVPLVVPVNLATQTHQQSYVGRGPAPNYSRQNNFDIYDLYDQITPIHNPYTPLPGLFHLGPKALFERNSFGQPKFVDEP
jgi:murein DD-endopeptidase MepM/ murein hydrolase activator NlpD